MSSLLDRVRSYFATFLKGGYELLVPRRGSSDFPINSQTLLTYAPIWYSTGKIGGHIAQMPRRLKRELPDESIESTSLHGNRNTWPGSLTNLMNLDPKSLMTAADLFETVQKDAIIDGNGRIGLIRAPSGAALNMIRLTPRSTWTFITLLNSQSGQVSDISDNGSLLSATDKWHHVTDLDGSQFVLHDDDVIHIKGLQNDGITGIPLWYASRDSTGGGKTAEAHTNRIFSNEAIPGLILQAPAGVLNNDQKAKDFLQTFREHLSGANTGSPALLRYGVTATQLGMDNRASQLLELRQFSRDEAWLWTGDIQFYSGADNVYKNGDDLENAYTKHTLARWVHKWEQEMSLKLLSQRQRDLGWYIDFDMRAILRGTMKTQMEILNMGRQAQILSEEDGRRAIGESPSRKPGENYDNPNTSSGSNIAGNGDGDLTAETEAETDNNSAKYPGNLDRDRWIYEQHLAGEASMAQISGRLCEEKTDWEPIGTARGIRTASHRYADFHGLARVNRHAAA